MNPTVIPEGNGGGGGFLPTLTDEERVAQIQAELSTSLHKYTIEQLKVQKEVLEEILDRHQQVASAAAAPHVTTPPQISIEINKLLISIEQQTEKLLAQRHARAKRDYEHKELLGISTPVGTQQKVTTNPTISPQAVTSPSIPEPVEPPIIPAAKKPTPKSGPKPTPIAAEMPSVMHRHRVTFEKEDEPLSMLELQTFAAIYRLHLKEKGIGFIRSWIFHFRGMLACRIIEKLITTKDPNETLIDKAKNRVLKLLTINQHKDKSITRAVLKELNKDLSQWIKRLEKGINDVSRNNSQPATHGSADEVGTVPLLPASTPISHTAAATPGSFRENTQILKISPIS